MIVNVLMLISPDLSGLISYFFCQWKAPGLLFRYFLLTAVYICTLVKYLVSFVFRLDLAWFKYYYLDLDLEFRFNI